MVEERFDTTPAAIEEANTRKNLIGSAKAGSLGFNAHAANVVAAVFLATGQDAAQVVEGANAITTVEARDDALYASVNLASLEVGTVGGGTTLPTQREALDVLGVRGGGDPRARTPTRSRRSSQWARSPARSTSWRRWPLAASRRPTPTWGARRAHSSR